MTLKEIFIIIKNQKNCNTCKCGYVETYRDRNHPNERQYDTEIFRCKKYNIATRWVDWELKCFKRGWINSLILIFQEWDKNKSEAVNEK